MKNSYSITDHLKFIIPSIIGVFLFMIPIKVGGEFTIPIAILSGWLGNLLTNYLSLIMMIVICLTALFTLIATIFGRDIYDKTPFFRNLFGVTPFWTITRLLAAIFAVMTYFKIGPEAVWGADTGQVLLGDLLHTLFTVFLFAGLFLPLLMNFGLMEMFGTLMSKVMRPLFKLPGRSSIDCLASWIGDGTIGVLLTSKQYEDGYYTKQEAAVIGTTFSVVSITFTLVVLKTVHLGEMFVPFYLTVLLAGVIAALVMPRIPPLSLKAKTYVNGSDEVLDESAPEGTHIVKHGYDMAIARSRKEKSIFQFLKSGGENVLDMWMGVSTVVMAFGTIALIIATYTPFFKWVGMPFIPLLELLQIPEAAQASQTIIIGFADMFLPSVLASSIDSEMTRFVVAALSVTQLIYMSEVGGLLLGSKIPVNFKDLILIFLIRTVLTLLVIVGIAHLLF